MKTFTKEITFLDRELLVNEHDSSKTSWVSVPVTKTATFEELTDDNPNHHLLQFHIMSVFSSGGGSDDDTKKGQIKIDPEGMLSLVKLAIKTLLVPTAEFTEQDKTRFLATGSALMQFGMWFMGEKLAPFFAQSSLNLS
jgi:hypothetical protein